MGTLSPVIFTSIAFIFDLVDLVFPLPRWLKALSSDIGACAERNSFEKNHEFFQIKQNGVLCFRDVHKFHGH